MTLSPAPFEDPSMPRTSPSEDPQTFMGPFSFFLVLSALVKLLSESLWPCVSQHSGYSSSCSGWERCQPAHRPISINRSASVCQWTLRVTSCADQFSSQILFPGQFLTTYLCNDDLWPFFYKILLLLKTFCWNRFAAVPNELRFAILNIKYM